MVDIDRSARIAGAAIRLRLRPAGARAAEQELIVHASASEAGLRLALDRAAFEARIVEASWFGDRAPSCRSARRSMLGACA